MIAEAACGIVAVLLTLKVVYNLALPVRMLLELKRELGRDPAYKPRSDSWMPGVEISLLVLLVLFAWLFGVQAWGFTWPWIAGFASATVLVSWMMMPVTGTVVGRLLFSSYTDGAKDQR